jgi:eukaryotic-like serine/threonine-protein kinase
MDPLTELRALLHDRYAIDREIGRGGMGVVLLAEDLRHGRRVAIKVLLPELAATLGRERFLREIRISAQLNHPNILTLIDSGEAGGYLYYVMPYVEGESLRDRIVREQQLPIDEAVRITRELADALEHAHRRGIIHRDIKPENVLLVDDHPVIMDFGVARALSEAGGSMLTSTGLSVGTPTYMSPEQAAADGEVDARSDVYALACVLYEMLAGAPPFTGPSAQAILARKLVEQVPGLRVVRETVPPALESAVMRGLARVRADRYASAREFVDALASESVQLLPAAYRHERMRRRRAAAVILAAAVVPTLWIGRSWTRSEAQPLPNLRFDQLTAEPGVEWFPSISPDGEWLVYSGLGTSGSRDIFLRSVGGQNAINLTHSPDDDDQPAFSPDGQHIAFRSERGGGGIFVMQRTGEAVRRITREGYRPAWSPDGRHVAYVTENVELNPQNADGTSELWVVDVGSGEARRVEGVPDAVLPSWSPRGDRIAYFGRFAAASELPRAPRGRWRLWTVSPDGGEPVPVTDGESLDWSPAWSADGRHLYFASDRGGSMNLWRIAIDERTGRALGSPEPLTTPATSLAHAAVSRDGRRIVYSSVLVTINIQRMPLDPATALPAGEPTWVTTGTRRWSSPDPSPDGRLLAMYSLTQPDGHIFVINTDGTGLRQVTGDAEGDRVPRWSHDGEWISFFSGRGGKLQPWRIRADGSELQLLAADGSVTVWSPDGGRVATAIGDEQRVQLIDLASALPAAAPDTLPVDTTAPFFTPNDWSRDGRWIVGGSGFGDAGVAVYDVATQRFTRLTDFGQWPVWLRDGRTILFVSGGNAFHTVDRVTGRVRQVYTVERDVLGPPRLTRDGRTAFFSRRVTEADIWMATIE